MKGKSFLILTIALIAIFMLCFSACNDQLPTNPTNDLSHQLEMFAHTIDGAEITVSGLAYGYENLDEIVIPDGVTVIDNYAFSGLENLTSISLPNTLKRIEMYAFSNCPQLETINIPNSIEKIGRHAFEYCDNLSFAISDNTNIWETVKIHIMRL